MFEKLKGIIKDHQKKSKIKTPKIDPIFGIFLRLVNLPVSKLGNQNVKRLKLIFQQFLGHIQKDLARKYACLIKVIIMKGLNGHYKWSFYCLKSSRGSSRTTKKNLRSKLQKLTPFSTFFLRLVKLPLINCTRFLIGVTRFLIG